MGLQEEGQGEHLNLTSVPWAHRTSKRRLGQDGQKQKEADGLLRSDGNDRSKIVSSFTSWI